MRLEAADRLGGAAAGETGHSAVVRHPQRCALHFTANRREPDEAGFLPRFAPVPARGVRRETAPMPVSTPRSDGQERICSFWERLAVIVWRRWSCTDGEGFVCALGLRPSNRARQALACAMRFLLDVSLVFNHGPARVGARGVVGFRVHHEVSHPREARCHRCHPSLLRRLMCVT